jgi:Domain of unknown function (DUF5916)
MQVLVTEMLVARIVQSMTQPAAVALCLGTLIVSLHSQPATSPPSSAQIKDIHVPRLTSPPRIEQFLGGASRADMQHVDDFRQRQPGDGVPVSRKTSAWIGYDERNFYAVFVCDSPAGQTRARMAKREDIMSDDLVGVFFDTYHSGQRGYEFFVNPLGIQADAALIEGQNDDFSFDTLWYSEGRLTPEGFVVMFSIPFRSLRFASHEVQTWGFGLYRGIPTNNENSFWPYVTEKVSGFTPQLGKMTGLENISPGRNLQLIPYAAFSRSHFLDRPGSGVPAFRGKTDFRPGLDAKAVIHDTLTLDVALNPDFSQVESDDPQVTVNQRFEVVFPEKRPFFLENTGYFSTPENLFFSRRIADPEFGGRITGKLGHWNLGVLAIDDRAAGAGLDPGDPNYGGRAAIGVVRVQREFGKSNVGLLVTDRQFAGSYNRVAALDTRLTLTDTWTFAGQVMSSRTRELDGTQSGGPAYNFDLFHQNRKWLYDVNFIDRSEGFHTDLGYVPRVNMRQAQQFFMRRFHPKSKRVLVFAPNISLLGNLDHHGVQQDWRVNSAFNLQMPRGTFMGAGIADIFERFQNIDFRRHDANVFLHTEYFKRATFDFNYARGTRINYDPAAGLYPFLANGSELQAGFTLRPVARLKIDEVYYLTRMRTAQASVFVNHLTRSRINYQFTHALSLRMIADYNAVLENASLIDLQRQKRITGDVLLTYLIHPGTALYVGYTDQLENLGLLNGVVRPIGFPSTTTARQFFAKVSYLFRF